VTAAVPTGLMTPEGCRYSMSQDAGESGSRIDPFRPNL